MRSHQSLQVASSKGHISSQGTLHTHYEVTQHDLLAFPLEGFVLDPGDQVNEGMNVKEKTRGNWLEGALFVMLSRMDDTNPMTDRDTETTRILIINYLKL